MRIVIVGAGAVGFHLAERLAEEAQDVVLIDTDHARVDRANEQLDVLAIAGNGAALPVLEQAGLRRADLLLAVSGSDEANLIACLAAAQMGVKFKVARISNPEYYAEGSVLSRERLGVDLMINPERECAWETFQLLNSEAATDLARFADGQVMMIALRVREGAAVVGRSLAELDQQLKGRNYITAAIARDGHTEIPKGTSRIEADDHIVVLAPTGEMPAIVAMAGYETSKLRRVLIAGGSEEAVFLARYLEEHDVGCTILDTDRARCGELAALLPRSLILHGDATDLELLEMEGVEGVDGFVAYTGHDDTNMLSCLLAKTSGARRVISLINRYDYIPLVSRVGIDAAVSPRRSTVNAILRYVRRGNIVTAATVKGLDAEVLELDVPRHARVVGRPLRDVHFPRGGLVGLIVRKGKVILPRGNDVIQPGDRVVVFALPEAVSEVERLLA